MTEGKHNLAPVGRRIAAAIVDLLVIVALAVGGLWLAWLTAGYMNFPRSSLAGVGEALNAISPAALVFNFVAIPLYFAVFESSAWHATPGKRLFGLEVLPLPFWRSLVVRFCYWLPWILLPFGYIVYSLFWVALLLMAASVAGIFCDRQRRSAADYLLGRLVVCRNKVDAGPETSHGDDDEDDWFARLPAVVVGGLMLVVWLLAPVILTFSFGQAGNLIYKRNMAAWRDKGIYKLGRVVFVDRSLLAPHVLNDRDLAEFEVPPEFLPPQAVVSAAAAYGKKVLGILPEGSLLTLDNLEKSDAQAVEAAEVKMVAAARADTAAGAAAKKLTVFRWRETVKRGQLVAESDIEPVLIDQEQYSDSMCFARWQIVGRRISENCKALRRDIIHFQYVDMPFSTLVARRAMKAGQKADLADFDAVQLQPLERYYSAVSAPQLVQGLALRHDVVPGQYMRYCDF